MSLKNQLVKGVRAVIPRSVVRLLEELYRRSRAWLVAAFYGFPARKLKVIAVTGTNGKTTVVNFVNEILKASGKTTAMFSTANIEIAGRQTANDLNATVSTVAHMQRFFKSARQANADYVIMEFPSHALHQHKLAGVPVEVAVMTNLTQDHLDYHKTMEAYAEVKTRLFQNQPPFIVLNSDDEWFENFAQFPASKKKLSYGQGAQADIQIGKVNERPDGATASIEVAGRQADFKISLPGLFNVYNAAAAIGVATLLGVDLKVIQKGVKQLTGIPGRFERVPNKRGIDIVVDYAHTPDGLEKLLEAARQFTKGRVFLVFGSCGDRDKGKRPIMGEIAARLADKIIVTDEENYTEDAAQIRRQVLDGVEKTQRGRRKTVEIADRREAIQAALSEAKKGDTILITGLGHEVYRIIDGQRVKWNDTAVVKDLL